MAAPSEVCSLGSVRFYNTLNFYPHPGYFAGLIQNKLTIQPRHPEHAGKIVDLTKLTSEDVIYWYDRAPRSFNSLSHKNVYYDANADFSTKKPLGYQWSRVQYSNGGDMLENTRQCLCMFCQKPTFFSLTGKNSLIRHLECMHPQELPPFVRIIMEELSLESKLQPRSTVVVNASRFRYDKEGLWPSLTYRPDGRSNQVRFGPRAGVTDTWVSLADVSERNVMMWFWRDINDLRKYSHKNVRYLVNPDFNPDRPEFCQILRVQTNQEGHSLWHTRRELCLHCQEPHFDGLFNGGFVSHVADYHWGVDPCRYETVMEYRRKHC